RMDDAYLLAAHPVCERPGCLRGRCWRRGFLGTYRRIRDGRSTCKTFRPLRLPGRPPGASLATAPPWSTKHIRVISILFALRPMTPATFSVSRVLDQSPIYRYSTFR